VQVFSPSEHHKNLSSKYLELQEELITSRIFLESGDLIADFSGLISLKLYFTWFVIVAIKTQFLEK